MKCVVLIVFVIRINSVVEAAVGDAERVLDVALGDSITIFNTTMGSWKVGSLNSRDFTKAEEIGRGTYGIVSGGTMKRTESTKEYFDSDADCDKQVALKEFIEPALPYSMTREIAFSNLICKAKQSECLRKNLVGYIGSFYQDGAFAPNPTIVFEKIERGRPSVNVQPQIIGPRIVNNSRNLKEIIDLIYNISFMSKTMPKDLIEEKIPGASNEFDSLFNVLVLEHWKKSSIFDWFCSIFLSAANGLRSMHSKGVYHMDLKPENLFVDFENSTIRIGDFGNSCVELNGEYEDIVASYKEEYGFNGQKGMSPEDIARFDTFVYNQSHTSWSDSGWGCDPKSVTYPYNEALIHSVNPVGPPNIANWFSHLQNNLDFESASDELLKGFESFLGNDGNMKNMDMFSVGVIMVEVLLGQNIILWNRSFREHFQKHIYWMPEEERKRPVETLMNFLDNPIPDKPSFDSGTWVRTYMKYYNRNMITAPFWGSIWNSFKIKQKHDIAKLLAPLLIKELERPTAEKLFGLIRAVVESGRGTNMPDSDEEEGDVGRYKKRQKTD